MIRLPFRSACLLLCAAGFLSCGPDEELRRKYTDALRDYNQGEIASAAEALRALYENEPDFQKTRLYFGRALYFQRSYGEATRVLEEALKKNPGDSDARYWLARSLAQDPARQDETLKVIDELVEHNASHVGAWRIKGEIHENRKEIKEAIAAYRAATAAEKELALVHMRLGVLYRDAGLAPQAEAEFQRARLLAGEDRNLLSLIAAARTDVRRPAPPASQTPPLE